VEEEGGVGLASVVTISRILVPAEDLVKKRCEALDR